MITKFEVDTENFEVYFDNDKKIHVCKDKMTGEETSLKSIGILMQMGVLKPLNEKTPSDLNKKLVGLSGRLDSLEGKISDVLGNLGASSKPIKSEKPKTKAKKEEKEEKSNNRRNIVEKILQQTIEEADSDVVEENEEEKDVWSEI